MPLRDIYDSILQNGVFKKKVRIVDWMHKLIIYNKIIIVLFLYIYSVYMDKDVKYLRKHILLFSNTLGLK